MPLCPAEAALESKSERIARMMTRQYGVRVRIGGALAYVDGAAGEIVLPDLSEAHLAALGEAFDGFLDHECAHLLYTEFERAAALREPARGIWNALEDAWVERRMGRQYLGCGENLEVLDRAVGEKVTAEWEGVPEAARFLYVVGRYARLGHCPEGLELGAVVQQLVEVARAELERASRIASTAEAVELAQAIARAICRDLPAPSSPDAKPPEASKPVEGMLEAVCDLISGTAEQCDAEWLVNSVGEELAAEGEERGSRKGPAEYLVFSTAYDCDRTFDTEDRVGWSLEYRALREKVSDYIGTMAASLELALASQAQVRWVGGERRGRRWDRRALPRWFLGGDDDRVFSRKEQGEALDTAVSLLWDCSGSMGVTAYAGSKASLARLAAVAFHESLLRANVPHEVLAFNTNAGAPAELVEEVRRAKAAGVNLLPYSRLDEIDNRMVLVPFSGTDGRALCAINGNDSNRDGECVLWAARRLAARPEGRKVLIVGSDGIPQGAIYGDTECAYLKQVVQRVMAAGIEVIGIGIMSKSVKEFYPRSVVLREISALPGVIMQELINLLTSEAHRGSAKGAVGRY